MSRVSAWRRDPKRRTRTYWQPEATRARYERMYADKAKREEILANNRRWKAKNKKRVQETHERWLTTPNGQKHQFGLPTTSPDGLLEAIQLIRELHEELKNHEYR